MPRGWGSWVCTSLLDAAGVLPGDTIVPAAGASGLVAVAGTLFTDVAVITALLVPWAAAAWFVLRASDSRRARRSVGVLWDLTNYWPRMYHPWAPPAYNERAVPALERRVRTLLRDPASPIVIVSAHSQGAVIAFAVMNRLLADPDLPHERLRFLTYGQAPRPPLPGALPPHVQRRPARARQPWTTAPMDLAVPRDRPPGLPRAGSRRVFASRKPPHAGPSSHRLRALVVPVQPAVSGSPSTTSAGLARTRCRARRRRSSSLPPDR
ncbi:hypothetical protein GCM10025876_31720 [Demequina litorisediminis]|uniref:PE-PPE domain-containing protein n=1 Tax=Demequina litorisediminis TaxID=1849022 RepID=A0ABQ6IGI3_9MICO|nr:hypothetical protein GCM10025876_31720 [Demequina litorisediminis]